MFFISLCLAFMLVLSRRTGSGTSCVCTAGSVSLHPRSFCIAVGESDVNCRTVSVLQDAVSALLARTSAELLAVEQELAQEEEEEGELRPEEQRVPGGDW